MNHHDAIAEHLDAGRFSDALTLCEELIQQTGGRGELALLTARALVGLARLQEAETWVQRARNDLHDEDQALRLLAQIYRRRGWRVRAQAIERRLGPATARPRPQQATPTHVPPEPMDPTLDADVPGPTPEHPVTPVAETEEMPQASRSARMAPASTLPKLVSTSGTDIPQITPRPSDAPPVSASLKQLEDEPDEAGTADAPAIVRAAATVDIGPQQDEPPVIQDPLGLLSENEAAAVRARGAVRAVTTDQLDPVTPEEATPPESLDPTPQDATMDPSVEPTPVREPRPTTSIDSAENTTERARLISSRGRYTDSYMVQRRRSQAKLVVFVLLVATLGVCGILVYRTWKEQVRERALLLSQQHVDALSYDGLREARQAVDDAIGGSSQPDPALCARGAQVELYLWMYYTGERAYLQQARELLEQAELRGADGVETRFTRALWEGYLGDASVTLDLVEELRDDASLRPDRTKLLQGVAASATGDHARAAKLFEEAVSLYASSLNHLAMAREAERIGAFVDARDQLEGILSNEPGHQLAEVDLALLGCGAPTDPRQLQAVEAIQQQYSGLIPPRVMSRVHATRAHGHAARGDMTGANKWYNEALDIDPENPDILLAYGHELRVRGDLRDARGLFARVVKNQPYSGDALGELGIIAFLQDRPNFLSEKLDAFPEGARRGAAFHLASGLHNLMTGDADAAVVALQRTPEDLWGGEARLLLGEAQLAALDAAAARRTFDAARKVLQRHRGERDPLVSVARLRMELARAEDGGRVDGRVTRRALQDHGRYPIVLYDAARLMEVRGEDRRAANHYRKAYDRGQDFALALVGYTRVTADDVKARRQRAVAADTYLRISPRGPHAAAMKRITER